jgi:hypothetical protein
MNQFSAAALALLAAFVATPVLAQTNLVLPPYNGDPSPKVATEAQAVGALRQRGIVGIRHIGKVGDYWESDGILNDKPIVAYVFDSGAIEIKPGAPEALQSAALPPVDTREQSAELPGD